MMMMMMPNSMYTYISTICKHFPFLQNHFRQSHSSHCDFADHFAIVLVRNCAFGHQTLAGSSHLEHYCFQVAF